MPLHRKGPSTKKAPTKKAAKPKQPDFDDDFGEEETENPAPPPKKAAKPKQEIAKREAQEVGEAIPPELLDAMSGGEGLEEADRDSFAIPLLKVLQKMSPEVDSDDPAYVEGASPGSFFVTGNLKLYDSSIYVVPVHFRRVFIEWIPRTEGGGFVAEHDVATGQALLRDATRDERGIDVLKNGHELLDTRIHYVLIADPDTEELEPAVLSVSRTNIRPSKEWLNAISTRRLPNGAKANMYAQLYTLETAKRSNDQGSWFVFKARPEGLITEFDNPKQVLQQALAFREMILGGEAQVDYDAGASVVEEANYEETGGSFD